MNKPLVCFVLFWILFGTFLYCSKLGKDKKESKTVRWTSLEVDSWYSVQTSQKVSKVVLGLRKDGMVVWSEVKLDQNTNITGIMFQ